MSAQTTIQNLRAELRGVEAELSKARSRGATDGQLIRILTDALTPEQLVALHKAAVREDNQSLESAITKSFLDRTAPGATLSSRSGNLTVGAGTFNFDGIEKPVAKSRKQSDEDARDEQIAANIRKVRADINKEFT